MPPSAWLPSRTALHRPLLWTAIAMAALSLALAVLAVVAPNEITGRNGWFKPLKFSLSIALYTATTAWLLGLLPPRRALGRIGTGIALCMLVEIAVITGAAALGTTSHFNVSTPEHALAYGIMAVSVLIAWVLMIVLAVAACRRDVQRGRPARRLAVQAGLALTVVGMGLAFLMTARPEQGGIAGAHAVGAPDDGPGLWFLGWSTTGGDLRIGHFFGMHALQAVPLLALLLERLAARLPRLRDEGVRNRLVGVGSAGYLGLMALVTVQALAGEPITSPSPPTLLAGAGLSAALAAAAVLAVRLPAQRR